MKKTRTKLRKAYLAVIKKTGKPYTTIKEMRVELSKLVEGALTDERFVEIIDNNNKVYRVSLEIVFDKRKQGSLRYRDRNVGLMSVTPNHPNTVENDKEYV